MLKWLMRKCRRLYRHDMPLPKKICVGIDVETAQKGNKIF